ncbi:MAG: hypothetical protein ACMXYK_02195 [Candidatus Woesearchaeota archaeon]
MTIVGFNFNKINVEKTSSKQGKLTISNNFGLKSIAESKVNFGGDKSKVLQFEFTFESKYEPEIASIKLEGDLLFMVPGTEAEAILKDWTESKKLPNQYTEPIMNAILNRCNVESLILSRELNLPSPIPLPKVNIKNKE